MRLVDVICLKHSSGYATQSRWRRDVKRALLLAATTAFAGGLVDDRSASAASWVASPGRALNITQPIPEFAGRQFWLLLEPKWQELAGVKDEAFVQDSGMWHVKLPAGATQVISVEMLYRARALSCVTRTRSSTRDWATSMRSKGSRCSSGSSPTLIA